MLRRPIGKIRRKEQPQGTEDAGDEGCAEPVRKRRHVKLACAWNARSDQSLCGQVSTCHAIAALARIRLRLEQDESENSTLGRSSKWSRIGENPSLKPEEIRVSGHTPSASFMKFSG